MGRGAAAVWLPLAAAFVGTSPRVARAPPRPRAQRWDDAFRDLQTYKSTWGTADAPLGDALGRWCAAQRRAKEAGRLDAERAARLDGLGFSWRNPAAPTEADMERRWREMCGALAAYVAAHGDGQVPKKWRDNPTLGGWVAAVRRRGPDGLAAERRAALEAAGFEWVSSRACGSAFMTNFRALRDWRAAHGDAPPPDDLARWAAAQRRAAAQGSLSQERRDYLASIALL